MERAGVDLNRRHTDFQSDVPVVSPVLTSDYEPILSQKRGLQVVCKWVTSGTWSGLLVATDTFLTPFVSKLWPFLVLPNLWQITFPHSLRYGIGRDGVEIVRGEWPLCLTGGEGGIRTRSLCYILENKDLQHKSFLDNELCATIRYYSYLISHDSWPKK